MSNHTRLPVARLALFVLCAWLTAAIAPITAAGPLTGEGGVQVIRLTAAGGERANAVAFSADGRWLAVGTTLGIHLYSAQSQAEVRFIPTPAWVRSLAFSPDGELLAAGAYEASVRVWRVADGALVRELTGHSGWVHSVAFAPNGALLASASDDNTVRLWRLSDGAPLAVLTAGLTGVRAVAFSPDSTLLATGGYDNLVRIWRVPAGTLLRELAGHTAWVRCLAFAPDGQTLASGGFDTTARLWRVADGALLHTLTGHTATVMSVAFSPDGATLATGSTDMSVRLWQVAAGAAQSVLNGHTDFVFDVAFAPDGATLASAGADSAVRLWSLPPAAAAANIAPPAAQPEAAGSLNCRQCHHPQGSALLPNNLQPARVVEVSCVTCHTGGALVRSWDPTFARAPGPTTITSVPPGASDRIGLPHGTRDLSVEIAAPGNGEILYSGGDRLAFVPVAGRVVQAAGQGTDVVVSLEIWSGAQRVGAATTRAQADGSFSFALGVNVDQAALSVPIDLRDCQTCHDPTNEGFSAGAGHLLLALAGPVELKVSAQTPAGLRASDERWVTVDPSGQADVSVQIALEGAPGESVAGLPVVAETRLYEWRGRTFIGATGADGAAVFQVEALSAAATDYTFQIKPTLLNGRLYESVAPVQVVLAPGARSVPPIQLTVRARAGRIAGQLAGGDSAVAITAIHLPEGSPYTVQTTPAGAFVFEDLPIGLYRVLADAQALASQGLASASQTLNLAQSPDAEINLTTRPLLGNPLVGTLADDQGHALPFGWVSLGQDGQPTPIRPDSGAWRLDEWLPGARTLVASAPGFFSQAQALPASLDDPLQFRLTPLPGLRRLPWGSGAVNVPPETQARLTGQQIDLDSGWVWGAGAGLEPWVMHTAGATITLAGGQFALVNLPGQTAWFYLLQGQAEAYPNGTPNQVVRLTGPAMLALGLPGGLKAVPLDPAVLQAVAPAGAESTPLVWEPSLAARLRDGLAWLGIRTAQVVTILTYLLAIGALLAVPGVAAVWWARRQLPPASKHDS